MRIRRPAVIAITLCLLTALCSPAVTAQEPELSTLETTLIDSCTYGSSINLYSRNVTYDELERTYNRLVTDGLLPWYTSVSFQYSCETDTDRIVMFTPIYINDGNIDQALYEQQVATILDECVFDGMSQWQIALSIHDYLVANIAYDETMEKNTGYDALINGSTVCAGYAQVYQDLLQRVGIDCKYVVSEEMNHGWNLVNIDGQWYHVDLTWDDPSPNTQGHVSHEFFLLTDAQISSGDEPHYGWDVTIDCTDTSFTDAFWRDVESQICYESSTTCYLVRTSDWTNSVYQRNDTTGEETRIYKESSNYIDIGHGTYKYWHQGLSYRDGRLYLTTLEKLLSMNTDGTNIKTEHTYNAASNRRYIQGSYVEGNTAYLSAADHDGNTQDITVTLASTGGHKHNYTVTQVPAGCLEDGYTLSRCSCGQQAKSDPTKAVKHRYCVTEYQKATLFQEGRSVRECENCQDTYTVTYAQLTLTEVIKDNLISVIAGCVTAVFVVYQICRSKKKKKSKV